MISRIVFLLLTMLLTIDVHAQQAPVATGVVYHDQNKNGKKDKKEPGIASVSVSNGREVVQTDAKGRYSLPASDDMIIFVIKPGNYNYPTNALGLVQFFYRHKPKGSPALRYKGVDPTGKLPASIDFPLHTGRSNDEFRIVAMSDPQPYSIDEVNYYDRDIVEELKGIKDYDFGITLGDLVGDNLDLFEPLNIATSKIGLPWFHVLGNHDINFDVKERAFSDETYERVYGPADYAFNHGKVHFIVLNDVIYPNPFTASQYIGGLDEKQFEFIKNTLKFVPKDHLVVINVHIPIFNEAPFGETFKDDHRRKLFELLKDHPHTLSLSGHTHTQRHHFFAASDGWLQEKPHHHYNIGTASGDWWSGMQNEIGVPDALMRDGTPNGYVYIHFTGNTYRFEYKVAGKPETHKMQIYGPKKVPQNARFRGQLYVNFYQGTERCKVSYRIDQGEWRNMNYVIGEDPTVSGIRHFWDSADIPPMGIRPSNPVLSYHIWRANIPSRLELGIRKVEVRIIDYLGRTYNDTFEFEVVAPTEAK